MQEPDPNPASPVSAGPPSGGYDPTGGGGGHGSGPGGGAGHTMLAIALLVMGLAGGFFAGEFYARKFGVYDSQVLRQHYAGECYRQLDQAITAFRDRPPPARKPVPTDPVIVKGLTALQDAHEASDVRLTSLESRLEGLPESLNRLEQQISGLPSGRDSLRKLARLLNELDDGKVQLKEACPGAPAQETPPP